MSNHKWKDFSAKQKWIQVHCLMLSMYHYWKHIHFVQIERQLRMYLHRVEDVLGKDWENHVEGQGLKADGDSFRQKLNTQEIFDAWSQQV